MTITICDKCGERIKGRYYLIEAKLIPNGTTLPIVEYLDVCIPCWSEFSSNKGSGVEKED